MNTNKNESNDFEETNENKYSLNDGTSVDDDEFDDDDYSEDDDTDLLGDNFDHPYEDYGRSYSKYGGYNGWSDDAIDDVFDGNPDATWNVD